jgi:hypothetical protein
MFECGDLTICRFELAGTGTSRLRVVKSLEAVLNHLNIDDIVVLRQME